MLPSRFSLLYFVSDSLVAVAETWKCVKALYSQQTKRKWLLGSFIFRYKATRNLRECSCFAARWAWISYITQDVEDKFWSFLFFIALLKGTKGPCSGFTCNPRTQAETWHRNARHTKLSQSKLSKNSTIKGSFCILRCIPEKVFPSQNRMWGRFGPRWSIAQRQLWPTFHHFPSSVTATVFALCGEKEVHHQGKLSLFHWCCKDLFQVASARMKISFGSWQSNDFHRNSFSETQSLVSRRNRGGTTEQLRWRHDTHRLRPPPHPPCSFCLLQGRDSDTCDQVHHKKTVIFRLK